MSLYPIPSEGVVSSPPRVSIMSTQHIRVLSIVCLRNVFKDVFGGTYDGLSDEFLNFFFNGCSVWRLIVTCFGDFVNS